MPLGCFRAPLGRLLGTLGSLLGAFWVPWKLPGAPKEGFGASRDSFSEPPGMFGHAFCVQVLDLHNALIAAGNPNWHSLKLFVPSLQRGGTCAAHGMEPSWAKIDAASQERS